MITFINPIESTILLTRLTLLEKDAYALSKSIQLETDKCKKKNILKVIIMQKRHQVHVRQIHVR